MIKNIICLSVAACWVCLLPGFSYLEEPHRGYNSADKGIRCTIKTVQKLDEKDQISLKFVVLFENLNKSTQEIFLAYTQPHTPETPGFSLPLNLHLQIYKEEFWWAIGGYAIILKPSPIFSIPGESRKTLEFIRSIKHKEYLQFPLRLKIQGHPVTEESWTGEINIGFSIPFTEASQKGTRDAPIESKQQ